MKKTFLLLLIFTCLEVISQTYGQRYGSKDIASILYFLSGISIGILPLLKTKKESKSSPSILSKINTNYFSAFAFILIAIAVWIIGTSLFQQHPLDYKQGDMLPIIQIMGERWLSGNQIYAIIPDIWEGMQPIYLPAMWMPYASMVALGVDIRITNLIFILIAVFLILDIPAFKQKKSRLTLLVLIPLLILLSYIFIEYSTLITLTEEPIVLGFYVLLAYSLVKNKPILFIIALSCCLLSRYALLFWAATYLFYSFFQTSKRQALIIGVGTGVLSLLLLYISQGIGQIELFISLKDAYLKTLTNPDETWGIINITQKNIGLARFFDLSQLPALHAGLFWGSLLIPPSLYTWYHFYGRHWIYPTWFALCSLKLCLVWFFNMNAMPYSYLFYTSTFLSLVILGQYFYSQQQDRQLSA